MLTTLSTITTIPQQTIQSPMWASDFRPHGAYLDEILFTIYTSAEEAEAMLALHTGDLDVFDKDPKLSVLNPMYRSELTFRLSPANRYRTLNLNTDRFPLNITGYRRAMAFGMDKYEINIEALGGAGIPLDSYIPLVATKWEVESTLSTHFYEKDIVSGNTSLEAAGFRDLDGDGWREYDANGDGDFTDPGDYDDTAPEMSIEMWQNDNPGHVSTVFAQEGLADMGMHSTVVEKDLSWILDQMVQGAHYVTTWIEDIPIINPTKALYDRFRTGTPDNEKYYKFSNSTIDEILDRMVTANTLEEVKIHVRNATSMLAYEQPQIVCYNDVYYNAWRNDKFTGFENFSGQGYTGDNPYSCTKIRLLDDQLGGSIKYRMLEDLETPNVMTVSEKSSKMVLNYIYEGLWQSDPITWEAIPQLAYAWDTEHGINDSPNNVVNGDKYTFYLYENETWHDGTPFISADVKFSIEEIWPKSSHYPTTAHDIYKVTAPDNYTVEIWVNNTSYFHWSEVTGIPYIVPEHIWNAVLDVSTFVPSISQIIGTGPYKWVEYVPGEYLHLTRHVDWRWGIRDEPNTTTNPTSGFATFIMIIGIMGILLIRRSIRR